MKIVSVAEMRAIEQEADGAGWTYRQMMAQAGKGLAEIIQATYGFSEDLFAVALVGAGNNGGDALVALTVLAQEGWKCAAYLSGKRAEGDSLVEDLRAAGGLLGSLAEDEDFRLLDSWLWDAGVLIDGVLGTGARLPLRGELSRLLAHVRDTEEGPPVVAVDCPSGVDCDNGAAADECIPADMTVCMAAVKNGLLKHPAFELAGEIQLVSIGLPEGLKSWDERTRMVVDAEFVRGVLPVRLNESHKGTFGTAVIAAGSMNYPGAALLAGKACLKMGTGLVTLAAPAPLQPVLAGHIPEATWILLPHEAGCVSGEAQAVLRRGLERADALLVGPGFGLEDCTAEFVRRLVKGESGGQRGAMGFVGTVDPGGEKKKQLPPLVFDADGLKLLARTPGWAEKLPAPAVLTPHPGEMAVLTGLDKEEIQAHRVEIAERYAREWGHVVVLKGAFSVIAAPDGRCGIVPVASSALAHAGSGDVLAGMIAGLRAQGVAAFEAAAAGAWLHAHTGLAAEERLGHAAGVTAGELLTSLPEIIAWVWQR